MGSRRAPSQGRASTLYGAAYLRSALVGGATPSLSSSHRTELRQENSGVWQGCSRVLDVAAGYGEPALTAARKAGPEGRIVATGISAAMLTFGRERAATAGVGNVEFVQSDAARPGIRARELRRRRLPLGDHLRA